MSKQGAEGTAQEASLINVPPGLFELIRPTFSRLTDCAFRLLELLIKPLTPYSTFNPFTGLNLPRFRTWMATEISRTINKAATAMAVLEKLMGMW